ncbi:STAS domain-containing protein [Glaciecola sp. MH2013]|uniref:STAS domain-containing protein n=1 Tax=Glaciecola sp. MH2013 TaxID=2785524 RepID=UPI00189C989C|nr:STAS domain-containing protein [Glaciecola sp. MH2013]MBF7074905.1 STAS domain-containing protein [Glaciecola sp. MH2013]
MTKSLELVTTLQEKDGDYVLSIAGELSQLSLKKDYWLALNKQDKDALIQKKQLVVDLSKVQRADSAGLAWLLNLKRDLNAHTINATICHSPEKLINLARLSNTEALLA